MEILLGMRHENGRFSFFEPKTIDRFSFICLAVLVAKDIRRRMMKSKLLLLTSMMIWFVSCSSTSNTSVTRTAADEVIDLSGRWNDVDSRMTAETMVQSMLSAVWATQFVAEEGRPPVVIVGSVRNRSSEHIDVSTFIKDIERELVNSGRVSFVVGGNEREEIRAEREDQQSNANQVTAAALAAETGADYMMQGVVTSQTDAIEGKRATLYKVDMELIDLETNQKVWIDTKQIKKLVEQEKE